jgi:hypothetical protein
MQNPMAVSVSAFVQFPYLLPPVYRLKNVSKLLYLNNALHKLNTWYTTMTQTYSIDKNNNFNSL